VAGRREIEDPPSGSAVPRVQLRRGVPFCACVFIAARLLLSALGVVSVHDAPAISVHGFPGAGTSQPIEAGWHNALDGTFRWDAGWFVRIAEKGYDPDDGSAEFYPAFPLVSRAFAWLLPVGALGAATLVSNVSFLLALILLYGLTTLEYTENVARRSVMLLASFPASFVFMAPYSESLFLLSSVAAFWWARRGRWRSAAIAGVIATATRAVGLVLIPALLIEAAREGDPSRRGRRMVAALVPAGGFLAYLAYWLMRSGDPLLPLRAPALWQRTAQVPFLMIGKGIALGVQGVGDADGLYWTADLLLTGAIVGALVVGWRSLRISYVVYAACTFAILFTFAYAPRPFLGIPRYAAVMFPAFWIMGLKLPSRAFAVVTAISVVGYVIAAVAFMNQGFLF
jgi:Mannosyltransferase (PIG-V)